MPKAMSVRAAFGKLDRSGTCRVAERCMPAHYDAAIIGTGQAGPPSPTG